MPELPEVETVRRQLATVLTGATFTALERCEPAMMLDFSEEDAVTTLPGRRIQRIGRQGKFIVVALDREVFLTLHLGMTGRLLIDPADCPAAHTRFVFRLEGGPSRVDASSRAVTLEFRDPRKFGRVHLTQGAPPERLSGLGPDAWQGGWDVEYLQNRLQGRTVALKAFLLDQKHLAGIGNIYADEILWWTGLSPLRPSGALTSEEVRRLAEEIPRRLADGVRLLGCSMSDFVDTAGEPGEFQNWLQAYGRQGQLCTRCGREMVRVVIAGRGTAYCPGCQK